MAGVRTLVVVRFRTLDAHLRRASRAGAFLAARVNRDRFDKDFMNTPRSAAADRPNLPLFERILCAVDRQKPSLSASGLAGLIADRFGASLEELFVESGPPAQAILERASRRRSDLIVLGARQRSDLGWQFRDDVVRDVSALADCATLTVHERDTPALIEHIVVPVEFGPATTGALEWASAFALRFGAKLQLLHVVSRQRLPSDAAAELTALERRVRAFGVDVGCQVIVAGSTANGIESYNDQGEFDLVVVGLLGAPESPARLTRGIIPTLRNRLPVPLLSVRAAPVDATRPRCAHRKSASRSRSRSWSGALCVAIISFAARRSEWWGARP